MRKLVMCLTAGLCLFLGAAPMAAAQKFTPKRGADASTSAPTPIPVPPAETPTPAVGGGGALAEALDILGATFADGEVDAFRGMLADLPEGVTADTIGQMMYLRRHWDKAAWFFGADALADPSDPASLNNYSAMLAEVYAAAPDSLPDTLLRAAYDASRMAVEIAPDNAAMWNNLGNAARALGLADEAAAAARRATELAPDESLYWANLARALEAAGDGAGAAAALAQARTLEPNGMAFLSAAAALPSGGAGYSEALQRACQVDFRCQQICPGSIIGGIQSVSCEIENANAQQACMEGGPYATEYDCREELPEYGILIPGLNSGFSICAPGFCAHAVVDGEGNVDVRVEAGVSVGPIGGYVRGDGHYSPTNGVSFDNVGGGVRVSLVNGSQAGSLASGLGHPPAHIEAESLDGDPTQVNVEAYNAGVISY